MMRKEADRKLPTFSPSRWPLVAYGLIVSVALFIDVITDRSFGAAMLSVLPISLVAFACLLTGPWLAEECRTAFFENWLSGAVLMLVI